MLTLQAAGAVVASILFCFLVGGLVLLFINWLASKDLKEIKESKGKAHKACRHNRTRKSRKRGKGRRSKRVGN